MSKVRIALMDGMGRKQIHEKTFSPAEKTPCVAAWDLIETITLRDGDTLEVSFLTAPPAVNQPEATK